MLITAAQQRPAGARADRSRGDVAPMATRRAATALRRSQADALWAEYRRTKDERVRERLIVSYAPLVKRIARRHAAHVPVGCDVEDLISCGLIELITAIDRYDSALGPGPESFLWPRIEGAIRDHRRKLDWLPRSVRQTEGRMQAARLELTAAHGREPSSTDVAGMLGLTPALARRHEQRMATAEIASLNEIVVDERTHDPDDPDDPVERIDVLHSVDASSDPWQVASIAQAEDRFRAAFNALTARQREIVTLLYAEELTLRQAGVVVGLSGSRVSQIRNEIRGVLRLVLSADEPLHSEIA